MSKRIAILDLGTNTFNLLIAEKDRNGNPVFIYSKELAVELGKGGIHKAIITPEATERAIKALHIHRKTITEHGIEGQYAFATSAVRGAENKKEFIDRVRIETGVEINALSGDEEAKWIYEGVKHAAVLGNHTSVIMDIGGGSTEFIIANKHEIFWKKSYPLGVTRLFEIFEKTDPLTPRKAEVRKYIADSLKDMFAASNLYKPIDLIGSSGSFDSFAEMIQARINGDPKPKNGYDFPLYEFSKLADLLMKSTTEERLKMDGLIEMRAPMFAFSAVLTDTVLSTLALKRMRLSHYALKEGIAGHLMENL